MNTVINVSNLTKTFVVGAQDVQVLKGLNFDIERGEFVVIIGPSGCGKSTLLHTLLGLEVPTTGSVTILGKDLYKNTVEDDRSEFRKQKIGMIYQQANWIRAFSVVENITFPLLLRGVNKSDLMIKASKALESVGMMNWAFYLPSELSSGQQQKIALARAIINDPEIIIADEPTGNLDYISGQDLMQHLSVYTKADKTILMVTHDLEYLRFATKAIRMLDGKIVDIYEEKDIKKLTESADSKRGVGKVINLQEA